MAQLNAVKKITVKEILKGKPEMDQITVPDPADATKTIVKMVAKVQDFAVIYGQAHTVDSADSQFGPYSVFIGRFEARRLKDGAVFQSTRLILPQIAEDWALMAFLEAKGQDQTALVDLAFIIGAEPDLRGKEGYKFSVKPVSTGENRADPLETLRLAMAPALMEALSDPTRSAGLLSDQSEAASGGTSAEPGSKSRGKQAATA